MARREGLFPLMVSATGWKFIRPPAGRLPLKVFHGLLLVFSLLSAAAFAAEDSHSVAITTRSGVSYPPLELREVWGASDLSLYDWQSRALKENIEIAAKVRSVKLADIRVRHAGESPASDDWFLGVARSSAAALGANFLCSAGAKTGDRSVRAFEAYRLQYGEMPLPPEFIGLLPTKHFSDASHLESLLARWRETRMSASRGPGAPARPSSPQGPPAAPAPPSSPPAPPARAGAVAPPLPAPAPSPVVQGPPPPTGPKEAAPETGKPQEPVPGPEPEKRAQERATPSPPEQPPVPFPEAAAPKPAPTTPPPPSPHSLPALKGEGLSAGQVSTGTLAVPRPSGAFPAVERQTVERSKPKAEPPPPSPAAAVKAGGLSLLVPGLGQWTRGDKTRAQTAFLSQIVAIVVQTGVGNEVNSKVDKGLDDIYLYRSAKFGAGALWLSQSAGTTLRAWRGERPPCTVNGALWRSLLVPGWGLIHSGHYELGFNVLAWEGYAWYWGTKTELRRRDRIGLLALSYWGQVVLTGLLAKDRPSDVTLSTFFDKERMMLTAGKRFGPPRGNISNKKYEITY